VWHDSHVVFSHKFPCWHECALSGMCLALPVTELQGHTFSGSLIHFQSAISECSKLSQIKFPTCQDLHRLILLFLETGSLIWSTFSSVLLIEGCSKCWPFSAEVTLLCTLKTTQELAFFPLSALQNLLSTF
jgi:hypothetical protein